MNYIYIRVAQRHATNASASSNPVCGNSDYTVRFIFDEEWDAYEHKTARFVTENGYQEVLFSGTECPMPQLSNVKWVEIGVYAGDLRTSTPAYIAMDRSILCGDTSVHPEPPADVYNQLLEKLNAMEPGSEEPRELGPKDITDALGYTPADFQFVIDEDRHKVTLPDNEGVLDYGTPGQIAVSNGNGGVKWENQRQQPVSTNFYTADRDELEATFGTQDITLSDTYFDEGATRVLDIPLEEVSAEYIYDLYDTLLGVEKENRTPVKDADGNPILGDDGEPIAYEYVISTGAYNTSGERGDRDADIKKPKYLVLNCIHGNEKAAALSAYWFFKDLVERKNVPSQFREGAEFRVIPVGNKYGANKNTRYNASGVDINRNFDYKWSPDVVHGRDPGDNPGDQIETQAIVSWLKANSDAELFIDFHNSSSDGRDENDKIIWVTNEVAMVVGLNTEKMKEVKRTALRGLDRVIPFWRYDRQYTEHNLTHPPENKNEPWGDPNMKAPVFSYSSYYEVPGASVYYATDKLDLPSITLECSILQNAALSDMRTKYPFTPETIAAGAEALGNILLEFYERSGGENHGKEGQFAVSDGKGGIKWLTVYTAEEVGY